MTHSGGKPHAVGDRGQRYEVSFLEDGVRRRMGWTGNLDAALDMVEAVRLHSVCTEPQILDRAEGVLVGLGPVTAAPAVAPWADGPLHRPIPAPKAKLRRCLKCETEFESEGPHNRLCPKCGLRARHSTGGLEPAGGAPGNHGRKGAA